MVETEKQPARRPAYESEAFKPSTFASRKADRLARGETDRKGPRFVSLGVRDQWLPPAGRTQRGQMVPVEILVDVTTGAGYRRVGPYGTAEPFITDSRTDVVEFIGFVRTGEPSGSHASGAADRVSPI